MIFIFILLALIVDCIVVLAVLTASDRKVLFGSYRTMQHAERTRSYLVHAPKTISELTPVVVVLHGFGANARHAAYTMALHNTMPEAIVVYPNAISTNTGFRGAGWNARYCCGSGWREGVDDVSFLTRLTQSVAAEYGATKGRHFLTGFSNGGIMTQVIAAESPESFAAYAPVSSAAGANGVALQPTTFPPMLLMHGELDNVVPFNGETGSSNDFTWLSFAETVRVWESDDGARPEQLTYPEDTHYMHDRRKFNFWNVRPQGSQEIVRFFRKYL